MCFGQGGLEFYFILPGVLDFEAGDAATSRDAVFIFHVNNFVTRSGRTMPYALVIGWVNPPFGNQDVAAERKATPIYSGVLMYFPDAIEAVAQCSQRGNDQHHADKPIHWDRSKSGDELDALTRHLMDAGTYDTDGIRHSAKVAWRALANLQKEIEQENM